MNDQNPTDPATNGLADADSMVRMTFRLPQRDKTQIERLVGAGVEPNESEVVRTAIQRYLCQQRADHDGELKDYPTVELREDRLNDHFDALETALEAASESRPVDSETVEDCLDALEDAYRHLLSAHPQYRNQIHEGREEKS